MMSMTDYFRELEGSRIRALVERDMELLWRLHAEEYQLVTPSGRTFGRERYLLEIESGNLQYWRWEAGPGSSFSLCKMQRGNVAYMRNCSPR